ncbi:hypothetical protein O0I10_003913 [Lichtheimia ornata]|uniref:Uncharacterized protein n=1 Tax=Lichtheimia ornata TaxID=688661 RepID=A0AAD7XZQ5_9FUNG|nr:uncharacterized protein O0I10_003913 [Lichtheimia ornata]KAJ8660455.1 hypothetical protein O0I10_003913 [Lichtheimia ornata]
MSLLPAKLDPGMVDLFDDDDQKHFWAVCDIERETFTQECCWPSRAHCSIPKTPRFIVKFGDTGTFMLRKHDAIWEVVFVQCQVAGRLAEQKMRRTFV